MGHHGEQDHAFEGWVAHNPDSVHGNMEWQKYSPKPFQETDVDIEISHSAVCGSDIHTLRNGWGNTKYPCCVGHEICGTIVRVGKEVQHLRLGQRVGVGPQSGACEMTSCEYCSADEHQHCPSIVTTYNGTFPDGSASHGGFSNYIRVPATFAIPIPDGIESSHAAPMLCAGITAWNALVRNGAAKARGVGIVGFGGVGMFAVLWAHALGCKKIVVVSRTRSKESDALAAGATDFIATEEDSEWHTKYASQLDLLVSTAPDTKVPLSHYLKLLRVHGDYVQVGLPDQALPMVHALELSVRNIRLSGTFFGSPSQIAEMLQFAADNRVKPLVELKPLSQANEILKCMENGLARYRYVLFNDKLPRLAIRSIGFRRGKVSVAQYLLTRLHQLGIKTIHGVPGDYNLPLMHSIADMGLVWAGNCNELNAGFAADGYARIQGASALVTTFGVGELSAINAVAGSRAERVPVIHIVGTPSLKLQNQRMLAHHTFANGDFHVGRRIADEIYGPVVNLTEASNIASEIDYVLQRSITERVPGYLAIPLDISQRMINDTPLQVPLQLSGLENDEETENAAVGATLAAMATSKTIVILVDILAVRFAAIEEVAELMEVCLLPVVVTPMGRGAVNERHRCFQGLYAGSASSLAAKDLVEGSDLVLRIGYLGNDFNTCGYTSKALSRVVDINPTSVAVEGSFYSGLHLRGVLKRLSRRMTPSGVSVPSSGGLRPQLLSALPGGDITNDWFWPKVSEFLQPNDIIVTETGSSNFGLWDAKLPAGATAIMQAVWGSIGFALSACQGAAQAARDAGSSRRAVLFLGDGAFQWAVQELSTIMRLGLTPVIFLLCNNGYGTERSFGVDGDFNTIARWKHRDIIGAFHERGKAPVFRQAFNRSQIQGIFRDPELQAPSTLQVVEVHLPAADAARGLRTIAQAG
ncbi:hypothetical protein PWT90_05199 [Aphanocladium album]|nr:hypothetical protein PWT90_05199 [Aphanocladium album]